VKKEKLSVCKQVKVLQIRKQNLQNYYYILLYLCLSSPVRAT